MTRIFNRFRPSRTGAFVSWDEETSQLTWLPAGAPEPITEHVQHDRIVRWQDFAQGDDIRVQDGEVSRFSSMMRGGARRLTFSRRIVYMHTGSTCIDHVAHPKPTVSLLCLRTMQAVFGRDDAMRHLRDFAIGASTRQIEAQVDAKGHRGSQTMELHMGAGHLTCMWRLSGNLSIQVDALRFTGLDLPETMVNALVGRPLSTICDHPAVSDPNLIIDRMVDNGFGCISVFVDDEIMRVGIEDALALLAAPLPKAA